MHSTYVTPPKLLSILILFYVYVYRSKNILRVLTPGDLRGRA